MNGNIFVKLVKDHHDKDNMRAKFYQEHLSLSKDPTSNLHHIYQNIQNKIYDNIILLNQSVEDQQLSMNTLIAHIES